MGPSLRELQGRVSACLLSGDYAPLADAVEADGFPGARRLQVYRNNVLTSLRGALEDVYPAIARLVGVGFFGYAAHEYIRAHPSRSGNLHDFGGPFPSFLEAFAPLRSHPYMADVARLEWACHEVFHAPDPVAAPRERLVSILEEANERAGLDCIPRAACSALPIPCFASGK